MKIAININELTLQQNTGVKVYTREIVRALGRIDKKNEYVLYSSGGEQKFLFPTAENFKLKTSKSRLPFWTYTKLPQEIKKDQPDVLFMPIQAVPFFKKPKNMKIVVTVHDLAFLLFPNHFTRKDRFLLNFHTKRAVRMADKIITPSEATRRDIARFYGIDEDKIEVIWHGITPPNPPLSGGEQTLPFLGGVGGGKKYNSYILFVGSIQPRKNITGLIEAFEAVKNPPNPPLSGGEHSSSPSLGGVRGGKSLQLIICGGRGWMADKIYKRAKESKFSKDIIFTGSVSDEERDELYKNALIFALPSLYEGFGLPVLEAMSFGISCVVGDNSSLSEIAGKSALLVDANNSNDIAEKINLLLSDSELRKDLSRRGVENAKRFSWNRAGEKTLSVLSSK